MNAGDPNSVRAAFVVEGTRGDIQPYIALALRMRAKGYNVKIFTHSNYVEFCESFRVPVQGVLYDSTKEMARAVASNHFATGNTFKIWKLIGDTRKRHFSHDLTQLWQGLDFYKPTVLCAGGLSKSRALLYSVQKNIPVLIMDLQISVPVSDKAPFGLPTIPFGMNKLWIRVLLSGASKDILETKEMLKDAIGVDVSGKFELPLIDSLLTDIPSFPAPCCYGLSTMVIQVHPEWPTQNFYPCGFCVIDKSFQERLMGDPSNGCEFGSTNISKLKDFLASGSMPVYIGWGSMLCESSQWMVSLAVEALEYVGARGIILGGWAGLDQEIVQDHIQDFCTKNVIFVRSAPHEWLFPQCSCIVHHGGAGTTAASLRSSRPTVITPLMLDQFDFAEAVNRIGCGIGLRQLRGVGPTVLGEAIQRCLEEESIIAKAKETGEKLRSEDGTEIFCDIFERWLTEEFVPGKWLEKHEALMRKCSESWERQQRSYYCTIS